ncbi:MAG: hypothetical protein N2558_04450 [Patescibacteria group bacterium]|nr:hypothetical protein [Patescibacteria group bacterium]
MSEIKQNNFTEMPFYVEIYIQKACLEISNLLDYIKSQSRYKHPEAEIKNLQRAVITILEQNQRSTEIKKAFSRLGKNRTLKHSFLICQAPLKPENELKFQSVHLIADNQGNKALYITENIGGLNPGLQAINLFPFLFVMPKSQTNENEDVAEKLAITIARQQQLLKLNGQKQINKYRQEVNVNRKTILIETNLGQAKYYLLAFKELDKLFFVKEPHSDLSANFTLPIVKN